MKIPTYREKLKIITIRGSIVGIYDRGTNINNFSIVLDISVLLMFIFSTM
jgi:hypothetical protein